MLASIESSKCFLVEIFKLVNMDTWRTMHNWQIPCRESLYMLPSMVTKLNNNTKVVNKYINNQVDALTQQVKPPPIS
jgi:hypothetical protein